MKDKAKALVAKLRRQGIDHQQVLRAILNVPREVFVPENHIDQAYENHPLSIGEGQTISQPYIVAHMTALLLGEKTSLKNVLEVGTGSGYQACILAKLVEKVYTVERIATLYQTAKARIEALQINNVHCFYEDGSQGLAPYAPYEGILVTSAASKLPKALVDQLAPGGRLVIPLQGDCCKRSLFDINAYFEQDFNAARTLKSQFATVPQEASDASRQEYLYVFERGPEGITSSRLTPVRFVPLLEGKE